MAYGEDEAAPVEESEGEGEDSGETFLAPKSAFYGKDLQPGDTETVRVKAVYEEELELECVKGEEEAMPEEGMEEVLPDA